METITSKKTSILIEKAIRHGKSEQIQVCDEDMAYLRMLISKYNTAYGTKISVRTIRGVYREICAPLDRFFDDGQWKSAFDIIQDVLTNDKYMITEDQFTLVQNKLQSIGIECQKRLISNTNIPEIKEIKPNDLLK